MDEEELCAGPEGVLLANDGAGACFLVSLVELAAETGGADAGGRVEVDVVRGVHEEVRPEGVVHPYRCGGIHVDDRRLVVVVVVVPRAELEHALPQHRNHHRNHHHNHHAAQP